MGEVVSKEEAVCPISSILLVTVEFNARLLLHDLSKIFHVSFIFPSLSH
jgi:hypothetical protein